MLFFQGIAPVSVPRPTSFPAGRRFRQPLHHIKPDSGAFGERKIKSGGFLSAELREYQG
jgi:hypothetical protein